MSDWLEFTVSAALITTHIAEDMREPSAQSVKPSLFICMQTTAPQRPRDTQQTLTAGEQEAPG